MFNRGKKITVSQVLDAVEKNGYTQAYGEYIRYNGDGTVKSACAIGQAALNLGTTPTVLGPQLMRQRFNEYGLLTDVWAVITRTNDSAKYPVSEVAKIARQRIPQEVLDRKIKI